MILSHILKILLGHSYDFLINSYRLQTSAKSLMLIDGVRVRRGKQGAAQADVRWSGDDGHVVGWSLHSAHYSV
jgi:hypothetical protein